jgi:serine protease
VNRFLSLGALVLALGAAVVAGPVAAQAPLKKPASSSPEPMIGQLMVKLRAPTDSERVQKLGATRVAALSKSAGLALESVRPMSGDASVMRLPSAMPLSQAQAVIDRLMADPAVEWAAPDLPVRRLQTQVPPDQGYASLQWNLFPPATPFTSTTTGGGSKTFIPDGGANLPPAWARTVGSASVTVAVLDTGIVGSHRDLRDRLLPGYDFVSADALTSFGVPPNFVANDGDGRDADASDPGDWVTADDVSRYPDACPAGTESGSSWHGTHMAGIVAAQWGNDVDAATGVIRNGTRTAGIGPALKILPVRTLGKCGGSSSDVIDAMRWAAGLPASASGQTWASLGIPSNPNPARVINLSLGGSGGACVSGSTYSQVVADVLATGAVIVAAAGNDGALGVLQPANCPGAIAVTAHVINGDNADYSNVGPEVAISAPGGGAPTLLQTNPALDTDNAYFIWSTGLFGSTTPTSTVSSNDSRSGDSLIGLTGTSPAAPHVTAAVALMLAANPNLTAANVRGFLTASARPHPAGGYCQSQQGLNQCGAGLLDVGAALTLVVPNAPAVPPAAPPLPAEPPPPSGGGGGGGSLPLWPIVLLLALGLAREVRRRF